MENSSYKLLIAGHDPYTIKFISGFFDEQYLICADADGLDILDSKSDARYDLILLNIPPQEQDEVWKKLRNMIRFEQTPVLIIVDDLRLSIMRSSAVLSMGLDDYITKPFSPNEVRARVNHMVARNKHRQLVKVLAEDTPASSFEIEGQRTFIKEVEEILTREFENEYFLITDLCTEMGMNPEIMRSKMQLATGMSFEDFQIEVAMQAARRLIETGKHNNLASIAFSVGIRSSGLFGKKYRERFGKEPK